MLLSFSLIQLGENMRNTSTMYDVDGVAQKELPSLEGHFPPLLLCPSLVPISLPCSFPCQVFIQPLSLV